MSFFYKSAFTVALGLIAAIFASAFVFKPLAEQARFDEAFARYQSAALKSAARHLRPDDLRAPLSLSAQRQLRSFAQEISAPEVARIVIWNRDQRIVFADLQPLVGKRAPTRPDLTRVFKEGRPLFERRAQDSQSPVLAAAKDFMDIYVPLRSGAGTTIGGVLEIYVDSQALLAPVQQLVQFTMWALALSGVMALGLILGLRKSLLRTEQERKRRAQIETLLGNLAGDIARLEVGALVKTLQDRMRDVLDVAFVECEIWDKEQLKALGGAELDVETQDKKRKVQTAKDSEWIFKNRQPLLIENLTQKSHRAPVSLDRRGIAGYAGVPISDRNGEVVGVLRLLSRAPRNFANDLELLQRIASCLSMALNHAQLQEQSREQALKLEIVEQKLADQTKELQRADYEIEQLAHALARDLQEPLRVVTSSTHLLAKNYGPKLDATGQEFTHNALDGAKRMHTLIGDVVAYARVATAQMKGFAKVESDAVLRKSLDQLRDVIREKGAVVTHDKLPLVEADELQLSQLLQHLIGNAIKYCHNAVPRVHVSYTKDYGFWCFKVKDNGIGIEPEFTGKIFAIFERLHTGKEYPGTGMGLSVCKKIVEHHGGKIWVDSQPGVGSTFCFTLPFKPVAKPRPASARPGSDEFHAER